MRIFLTAVLLVSVCVLTVKLFSLRRRIGSISRQLDDKDNTLITIELNGDELEAVVRKINLMKENEHKARLEVRREQNALKQAIADISHDIRTPLTSVIGYLQLAEKSVESEEQRTNISIALERAKYCSTLVNDFFELSVIDAKGLEPVMESVDVNDLLCELILSNFPNFEAKGMTPHFENNGKPVFAYADRKMLIRIIQNLISNGIKYGSDALDFVINTDEAVHISVSNSVSDNDIDTERMFDKFYYAGKSRSADTTGIGLYICKQFVEAMGGDISACIKAGILTVTVTLCAVFD